MIDGKPGSISKDVLIKGWGSIEGFHDIIHNGDFIVSIQEGYRD